MYNELCVVKVEYFKATGGVQTFDKNTKPNVILVPVCGRIPNQAQVLSGSVAMSSGILDSDGAISAPLQLVHVTERPVDPTYGRQFSVGKIENFSTTQLLTYQKELGKGNVEVTKVPETVADNLNTNTGATPLITSGVPETEAAGS